MHHLKEVEGKRAHDHFVANVTKPRTCIYVPEPVIVGAGPAGLAVAACLKERGVPSLILERSNCIASLWQNKTYDRLHLHLPKQFCELPLLPFPRNFPTYPTKQQFILYLETYASHFDINPVFNQSVVSAEFDQTSQLWQVKTIGPKNEETEYSTKWLIVATGENADEYVPKFEGMSDFGSQIIHSSMYKSGEMFYGKNVLVVGCGNSGMEVSLDLCNNNASPGLVVRDTVHILPQEMLGKSTFGLSMWLLKWFALHLVDKFLVIMSRIMLGDTAKYGLNRPKLGPLQLKNVSGKTPVLDIGTLSKIKSGHIKIFPEIKRFKCHSVEFVDGRVENFDAVILATGYKSNVPSWLKENNMFSEDGFPKKPFPNGWKGKRGLYSVGFTKLGLLGASLDAKRIAEDIEKQWKAGPKHYMTIKLRGPKQSQKEIGNINRIEMVDTEKTT